MSKLLAALLALGCLAAPAAWAQAYPTKPITILVPAAPGGVSDSLARALAQRFTEAWGQQVIVENRGGANHQIGAASVAKAPPDGHMLMLGAETIFVINPTLYGSKLAYDPKDFAPITGLVRANQALLAHPSFGPKTVGELIELAKKKPGEVSYATSGIGSAPHVNVALLESMAGIKLLPVHYRGAAPALNDVVAGHVQLLSVAIASALQPWRSGQSWRSSATTGRRSAPTTPAVRWRSPGYSRRPVSEGCRRGGSPCAIPATPPARATASSATGPGRSPDQGLGRASRRRKNEPIGATCMKQSSAAPLICPTRGGMIGRESWRWIPSKPNPDWFMRCACRVHRA